MRPARRLLLAFTLAMAAGAALVAQRGALPPDQVAQRLAAERELHEIAVVDRKVMMPMRDGVRLATDIYRPKGAAVKRGYAYVVQNERGHYFSEGHSTFSVHAQMAWIAKQPWSNGKIGTTGCSSTAEWQMGVAGERPPAYAAMNIQGHGAGIGRVGPYWEQGNWYRGGAVQMLFTTWIMREQNTLRPMFPRDLSQEDLIKASRMFDLVPRMPAVDWSEALSHLPVQDILRTVGASKGIVADQMPVDTGGAMIQREPNDPSWYKGGLYHQTMPLDVPGLHFMSWYDVSVGPNLALYNHARKTSKVADQHWAIIAPVAHCAYTRASADTVVGERSMGDARLNYHEIVDSFFDRFVKGAASPVIDNLAKVTYFTMGLNKWQTSDVWPPRGAQPMTFYLSSAGRANTMSGDGALADAPPAANFPRFDRNLNTGGRNFDESKPVVARNAVHHSTQYPSQVTITVVKR